jgi:hypothetical protein
MLGALSTATARSLEVLGYAGVLGEWEVTASVTAADSVQHGEFAGPLKMRHVGYCTVEGPEEKSGEIRLRLSSSRVTATLVVEGIECTYSGRLSDSYTGSLRCPDRRAVPLTLWLK